MAKQRRRGGQQRRSWETVVPPVHLPTLAENIQRYGPEGVTQSLEKLAMLGLVQRREDPTTGAVSYGNDAENMRRSLLTLLAHIEEAPPRRQLQLLELKRRYEAKFGPLDQPMSTEEIEEEG